MKKEFWIKKYWLEYTLGLSVLLTIISPALFTSRWIWPFSWPTVIEFGSETGPIGDTIGGLTAPVIGILNAVLLYITIRKQNEQIKEQRLYSEFDRLTDNIRKTIQELEVTIEIKKEGLEVVFPPGKYTGIKAISVASCMFSTEPQILQFYKVGSLDWITLTGSLNYIYNDVFTIWQRNFISDLDQEEKVRIYNSVKIMVNTILNFYESVKKYDEKFQDSKLSESFLILEILYFNEIIESLMDKFNPENARK